MDQIAPAVCTGKGPRRLRAGGTASLLPAFPPHGRSPRGGVNRLPFSSLDLSQVQRGGPRHQALSGQPDRREAAESGVTRSGSKSGGYEAPIRPTGALPEPFSVTERGSHPTCLTLSCLSVLNPR